MVYVVKSTICVIWAVMWSVFLVTVTNILISSLKRWPLTGTSSTVNVRLKYILLMESLAMQRFSETISQYVVDLELFILYRVHMKPQTKWSNEKCDCLYAVSFLQFSVILLYLISDILTVYLHIGCMNYSAESIGLDQRNRGQAVVCGRLHWHWLGYY